jgi:hypothetical protein
MLSSYSVTQLHGSVLVTFVRYPTENCLSGGTTFYPHKDRKLSASNNKRNNNRNYTRVYEYEEGESL